MKIYCRNLRMEMDMKATCHRMKLITFFGKVHQSFEENSVLVVFYGKGSGGKILGQKNDHCRPTIGDVALSNSKHNWTNYNQLAPQLKCNKQPS